MRLVLYKYWRTACILTACIGVLLGIVLAPHLKFNYAWVGLVFLILHIVFSRKQRLVALIFLFLAALSLGFLRGSAQYTQVQDLRSYQYQKVTYQVTAMSDGVYTDKAQLEFDAGKINVVPQNKSLPGLVKVSGFGEPMIYRGDVVEVTGKLYPTRGSRQGKISFAQIHKVGSARDPLEVLRHEFVTGMYNALPEPIASFALGLLIGQRSTMPSSLLTMFSVLGLTHIIAVSGYNVTILTRAVQRLRLGSKFQTAALALTMIALFIVVTGFSASIVRAGIVSTLSVLAWYYGRNARPLTLILFTASLTALYNPLYVWSDVGWYLSFMAFFGVLIVAPLLTKRFLKNEPKLIGATLIETFSAQLMTLPLILFIFGKFGPLSLIANLLIVPVVPLAMLFSAIAAFAGSVAPAISGWFALPAKYLIGDYMLGLIGLLSRLSDSVSLKISAFLMVTVYGALIAIFFVMWRQTSQRSATITDKN